MRRISDKDLYDTIEKVKNNDENAVGDALIALLAVTVDTRAFLRKLYKETVPAKAVNIKPVANKNEKK